MEGPTIQGAEDLIAQDPGAYWDNSTNTVKGSAFAQSPRTFPIPLYDPIVYDSGKRNGRDCGPRDRELDRLLPREHPGQRPQWPHRADRRHPRQDGGTGTRPEIFPRQFGW